MCSGILHGLFENSIHIANEVIAKTPVQNPAETQAIQYQDERLSGSTRQAGVNFQKRTLSPILEVDEGLD